MSRISLKLDIYGESDESELLTTYNFFNYIFHLPFSSSFTTQVFMLYEKNFSLQWLREFFEL